MKLIFIKCTFLILVFNIFITLNIFGKSMAMDYTYLAGEEHLAIVNSLKESNSADIMITLDNKKEEFKLSLTTSMENIDSKSKESIRKYANKRSEFITIESEALISELESINGWDVSNVHILNHTSSIFLTVNNFESYYALLNNKKIENIIIDKKFIISVDIPRNHVPYYTDSIVVKTGDYIVERISKPANVNNDYIAIIDGGFDTSHIMFEDKKIEEACYISTKSIIDCNGDTVTDKNNMLLNKIGAGSATNYAFPYNHDDSFLSSAAASISHGTHVAGTAVGNTLKLVSKKQNKTYSISGGLPDSNLIAIKVFYIQGDGELYAATSSIVKGFDHIKTLFLRDDINLLAISTSIGGSYIYSNPCFSFGVTEQIYIDYFYNLGIPVMISTGNARACVGVENPSCFKNSIAVGATDSTNKEASFSNYGDSMVDIYANGVDIFSAIPALSSNGDSYFSKKSGTSMSTPYVASAFAMLKRFDPNLSVTQILDIIIETGNKVDTRCSEAEGKELKALDMYALKKSIYPLADEDTIFLIDIPGPQKFDSINKDIYTGCSIVRFDRESSILSFSIGFIILIICLLLRIFRNNFR